LVRYTKIFGADEVKWAFQTLHYGLYNENPDIVDQSIDIITGSEAIDLIMKHASLVYPIIYPQLCRAAKFHWDSIAKSNAFLALQGLQRLDPALFKRMGEQSAAMKQAKQAGSTAFQEAWKLILDSARANDPSIVNHSFPRM
jgi:hypothetical protein